MRKPWILAAGVAGDADTAGRRRAERPCPRPAPRRPLISWCLAGVFLAAPLAGSVNPPLTAAVEVAGELADGYDLQVSGTVMSYGGGRESRLTLTLTTSGDVRLVGHESWEIEPVTPGRDYSFTTRIALAGAGEGSVRLQAASFDARGRRLWGAADTLFLLHAEGERLRGRSSLFELKREKLARDRAAGRLDPASYSLRLHDLLGGSRTLAPRAGAAAVAATAVSGSVRYTQRVGHDAATHADTFADPAKALPVRRAKVEIFDQDGAGARVPLQSTPAEVTTDDSGAYAATVPGQRGDGSAVQLVVRVDGIDPAARVGPKGQGSLVLFKESAPVTVAAAATTVDVLVDSNDLTSLRVFSLLDAFLTTYDYVVKIDVATGVGTPPAQIFVDFPGDAANNSFTSDDHINVGESDAFDWDVLTHEYGHYVRWRNTALEAIGGCHALSVNLTGNTCNGARPPLPKDQALRLAWSEAWATFFGTAAQIASGAGTLGIFGVADTRYTDTANEFATDAEQEISYDLEIDDDAYLGVGGEDNEVAVQRILWDFADQAQDADDELTFGFETMWKKTAADSTVDTLDAFRAKLDGVLPDSPAGYGVGSVEQNRAKQGRIYGDLLVGPEPVAPADHAPIDPAKPPRFDWFTRGAGAPPSYRFDTFKVRFFTADYGRLIFESPKVVASGDEWNWTPTAGEWAVITAPDPGGQNGIVKWVVEGGSTLAPATGPYRGLDRTLGAVDVAFVIDDTGSMSDAIVAVRTALTDYLTKLRAQHPATNPLIELITFKDEVRRRIVSRDLDAVQAAVDALTAEGGGDCPESSGEALLDAVKDLGDGAALLLATDASPHPGFDLAGIEAKIRARGIAITELVAGDCQGWDAGPKSAGRAHHRSDNHDPSYRPGTPRPPLPDGPRKGSCLDCPPDASVGPALPPSALVPIGDPSLPVPSAVVAYEEIAAASPAGRFLFLPGVELGDPLPFTRAWTNAALAATIPAVVAVTPGDLYPGATLNVEVLGGHTRFDSGSAVSWSDPGIHVHQVTALSATALRLGVTVDPGVAPGLVDVTVRTPLADGTAETTAGSGQARVVANDGQPRITSVQPSTVARGTTVDLLVTGLNTHFAAPLDLAIADFQVGSITVLGPTVLHVTVTVPAAAPRGFRRLTITGAPGPLSLSPALSVVDAPAGGGSGPPPAPAAPIPALGAAGLAVLSLLLAAAALLALRAR